MSKDGLVERKHGRAAWVLLAVFGIALAGRGQANEIPREWSFEDIAPGTAVVSSNGVGLYGWEGSPFSPSNHAAEVVSLTPPEPPNGYPLPDEDHNNVMQILGDVAANFNTAQTAGNTNIYIDALVQAGRLSFEPDAPAGAQVAAYFNSNGHLVVRHAIYTNNFGSNFQMWTTLDHTPVDSNEWVRLTIVMDYYTAGPGYAEVEHFYAVLLNGEILDSPKAYISPLLGSSDAYFPTPAGAGQTNMWFIAADSGFGGGSPNNQFFSALEFSGAGFVDDIRVTASLAPPPPCVPGYDCWIQSYYPACPSCRGLGDDPDGDGVTNWEEYLAGTDPTDPDSAFRIVDQRLYTTPTRSNMVVWFGTTNSGVYSPFTMYRATNLMDESYWEPVATDLARDPDGMNIWYDTNPPADRAFYRPSVSTNTP